jgi:hypothetical protein
MIRNFMLVTAMFGSLQGMVLACFVQQSAMANSTSAVSANPVVAALEQIKCLEGKWEAHLHGKQEAKVMVNTFHVIGDGSAVVHSEWLDGKQLMMTVFYLAGSELGADHYCDYHNQPSYVLRPLTIAASSLLRCGKSRTLRPTHGTSIQQLGISSTQALEIVENGRQSTMVRMGCTGRE